MSTPYPRPHIGLAVSDIDQAVAFYSAMLGMQPVKQRSDYAKFSSNSPALNLSLNRVQDAPGPRSSAEHFGIEVASSGDVNTMHQRMQAAGLTTRDEKNVTCCYAVQDKFWISDPDGHAWEVFTVLADASTRMGAAADAAARTDAKNADEEPARDCCAPDCCT